MRQVQPSIETDNGVGRCRVWSAEHTSRTCAAAAAEVAFAPSAGDRRRRRSSHGRRFGRHRGHRIGFGDHQVVAGVDFEQQAGVGGPQPLIPMPHLRDRGAVDAGAMDGPERWRTSGETGKGARSPPSTTAATAALRRRLLRSDAGNGELSAEFRQPFDLLKEVNLGPDAKNPAEGPDFSQNQRWLRG